MAMAIGATQKKQSIIFEMKKLEEAVHYICDNVTAADRLGQVKLNKILYYADMTSFAETGRALTGATYVKQFRGPVPTQVMPAIEHLEHDGRLQVSHVSLFNSKKREFEAGGETDTKLFEPGEIERLNMFIRLVCDHTAPEISEISHHLAWQAADIGEVMPYESFFVAYLGDVGEDEMKLALDAVAKAEKDGAVYG